MYFTGIRFRQHGSKSVRGWRLTAGVGKLRAVVAFQGEPSELMMVAGAIVFALSGKRHHDLVEVWLDAADDAGDVWTIERGTRGTLFRKNNRLLSTEEAQGSLLASLLDLDASLSQSEVLVAPVELRQMITRGVDVAATGWDLNAKDARGEVPAIVAAKDIASRCSDIAGHEQYADEKRLARVAGPSARLLGAWDELRRQAEELAGGQGEDVKVDPGLELIQSEIDVLNQIDQLLRRVNEGGESLGRLSAMLDSFDSRLIEIETKWSRETLSAVLESGHANQLVELLVRHIAYAKFAENLGRIKTIFEEQVRPAGMTGIDVWTKYISGARSDGQEIESCLASMLLGIKQMGQEIDRYVSHTPVSIKSSAKTAGAGWFERLKTNSVRMVDERLRDSSPALLQQREWISRLARDVDTIKVATEYALQSSQALGDKVSEASNRLQREMSSIGVLFNRVSGELGRLREDWVKTAKECSIPDSISVEQLTTLVRDASEYLVIRDTRQDLSVRVEDRRAINAALEAAVRQWWEIIGSQKSTDLSNLSFLIGEAKGALRYREGRRQRIQKGLEETANRLGVRSARAWVEVRREELRKEWAKLFSMADLPVMDLHDHRTRDIVDLAHRCAALLDVARIEEQDRFATASLWPSRLDTAVVLYRWMDDPIPPPQRTTFLKSLGSFTGDGMVPVILLISDQELMRALVKMGTGSATFVELDSVAAIEGPRREGAVVKAELKTRRHDSSVVPPTDVKPISSEHQGKAPNVSRSDMASKAEAALRVLNPKALR